MAEDANIVTTFYVEGKVSLHWDRQTGNLSSLHMISTLTPDDLEDSHISSSPSITFTPSMDDNSSTPSLVPNPTVATNPNGPSTVEHNSMKSSCGSHSAEENSIILSHGCPSVQNNSMISSRGLHTGEENSVDLSPGSLSVSSSQGLDSVSGKPCHTNPLFASPYLEEKTPIPSHGSSSTDANSIKLPPSVNQNPSATALISSVSPFETKPPISLSGSSESSYMDIESIIPPHPVNQTSHTDVKSTMPLPFTDDKPSCTSLSSFISSFVEKINPISSYGFPSTDGKSTITSSSIDVKTDPLPSKRVPTQPASKRQISDLVEKINPISSCESSSTDVKSTIASSPEDEKTNPKLPISIPRQSIRNSQIFLPSTSSTNITPISTPGLAMDVENTVSSSWIEKPSCTSIPSFVSNFVEKINPRPSSESSRMDIQGMIRSASTDEKTDPFLRGKDQTSIRVNKRSREMGPPKTNSTSTKPISSLGSSSMDLKSTTPEPFCTSLPSFVSTVAEKLNPLSMDIKSTLPSSSMDEKNKPSSPRRACRQLSKRVSSRSKKIDLPSPSSIDVINLISSLGSSCEDAKHTIPFSLIDEKPFPTSLPSLVTDTNEKINPPFSYGSSSVDSEGTVPSSSCDEKTDLSLPRRVTRQLSRGVSERSSEVVSASMSSTDVIPISFSPMDMKSSIPFSSVDEKPAFIIASVDPITPYGPSFMDVKSTLLSSSIEEKTNPLSSRRVTRQWSAKAGKGSRNINLPSTNSAVEKINPIASYGSSFLDVKNTLPSPSTEEKTNPLSPRGVTRQLSRKVSKRPREVDIPSTSSAAEKMNSIISYRTSFSDVKNTSRSPSMEEKIDRLPPRQVRQLSKKVSKRSREVGLPSISSTDRVSTAQQLVLASQSHRHQYLDGPSSSSRDGRSLDLQQAKQDARSGRNKRRRTIQHPFKPMDCCRPRNAFIFFSMRERPRVAAAHPHFDFGEISKLLARLWRNMSDADKEPYRIQAQEDASRYYIEVSESHRTWQHLADRGLQLLYVVDIVFEWLSKKLPLWARYLSGPSLGS